MAVTYFLQTFPQKLCLIVTLILLAFPFSEYLCLKIYVKLYLSWNHWFWKGSFIALSVLSLDNVDQIIIKKVSVKILICKKYWSDLFFILLLANLKDTCWSVGRPRFFLIKLFRSAIFISTSWNRCSIKY